MDSRLGLPVNTVLDGSYRIERVVGSGGFGITYEAEDINLSTKVAIKEYYPFDFGDRDSTMSVKPKSDRHRQTFDWGRSNFLQEARTLARFEHASIVRVTRVFEANSTAYMVMRFEQGYSFESWLRSLDRLPTQEELDMIVAPLLDALQMMHAENFLHRDIAPDNIIVRADGTPVLLDFGAARRAVAEMSRTMTGIVKAGYSPHEQYSSDSRLQGPWSDLYALGGTLYRAVTGDPPEEATLRVDEDHMPPAAQAARKSGYRPGFLAAIDACLKVRHSERPRSVAQLRPMMLGRRSQPKPGLERLVEAFKTPSKVLQKVPARLPSRPVLSSRTRLTGQPPASRRWPAVAAAILAALGGAYGGFEYTRWQPPEQAEAARRSADATAAKKRADETEARRQQEERVAAEKKADEERARQQAEAKRLADGAAAKKKADEEVKARAEAEVRRQREELLAAEERARQELEAKKLADAAAAKKRADEERVRQEAEAKRIAEVAAAEKRATEERARQEAEAKRIADAAAAKRKADEERARQETEAKRIADAAAAKKKADEERARQDAEAKRTADAAAAKKKADEERARQETEAKRIADAAAAKKKADEERAHQEAESKKIADAAAARKKADEERARQEAEARRTADAAVARKKADEERARLEAEAKRIADAAAAKKKADEERARQEAEAKRIADAAAAKKRADEERARLEAEAKKIAEAAAIRKAGEERARQDAEARRIAEASAAEEAARRQAQTEKAREDEPVRIAATTLDAEQRAVFVKRVQEVLKQSKCYTGAINGRVGDAQEGVNRFLASRKGKDTPGRIELAKASASDFDSWLRDVNEIKDGVCVAKEKPARQERAERSSPSPRAPPPRYSPPSGGGGGRVGPIQGIQ